MYDFQVDGEAAVLHLSGEVDLQSTSELRAEITKLVGVTRLEIRAGEVSYIDSSGVAILLLARKLCGERNIMLTIPVVSQALFRVLEIARLDSLLPIGEVQENKGADKADPGLAALDALATTPAGIAADDKFVWPVNPINPVNPVSDVPETASAEAPPSLSQADLLAPDQAPFDDAVLGGDASAEAELVDMDFDDDLDAGDLSDLKIVPGQFG